MLAGPIKPQDIALPQWSAVFARIADRAPEADRGSISLHADLRDLHNAGFLAELVPAAGRNGTPLVAAALLRRLGRVSLPVGRIVEGHVNALKLITLYGSAEQQTRAARQAASGIIFGVWGADASPAASIQPDRAFITLGGGKRFCSGLGLVGQAVLSAGTSEGLQLLLADVGDQGRADPSSWQVSGMRATESGSYDLNGLQAELLGKPGDYLIEPHFEGGTWRYCALHTGALEALAEFVRRHIGPDPDPHQLHRLARLVLLADAARLHVDAAAIAVETPGQHVESSVARALLAREAVEQACLAGLALAERALGTSAFRAGSPVDLCRRDLAFFLRQANLDGKLTKAASVLLCLPAEVGEQW